MKRTKPATSIWLKSSLVALVSLFFTIIALNNLIDYQTNWVFVKKVLSMSQIPETTQHWRAIHNETVQRLFYLFIIIFEFTTAVVCSIGALKLFYQQTKTWALCGLTLGIILYFGGFVIIGGEWFLMWQFKLSDPYIKALIYSIFFLLVIIIVRQE